MRPSEGLYGFLKQWEKLRLKAYQDSGGVWTIGYGHTADVGEGDECTEADADNWLAEDVDEAWYGIDPHIKVTLAQHEMDAVTSLAFNIGVGAFLKSTLLRRLNDGDFGAAADEFLKWNKVGRSVVVGLTRRRTAEKMMFEFASYGTAP